MPSRALRALPAALLTASLTLPSPVAGQAAAQPARVGVADAPPGVAATPGPDYRYRFLIEGEGEHGRPMVGTVRVHHGVARIDIVSKRESGEYILVSADGGTMTVVHPDRRRYEVSDAERFAQIVGTTLRALGPMVQVKLSDVKITSEALGGGPQLAGFPTQHYRVTEEYGVTVGALGFKGDSEFHVVSTDYWVSPGLTLARNPLIELMATVDEALAQKDESFVRQSRAARERLFTGTPLRILITAGQSKEGGDVVTKTRSIEITELRRERQDPALFVVPAGFERREGVSFSTGR